MLLDPPLTGTPAGAAALAVRPDGEQLALTRGLRTVLQPLVDLETGTPLAYEALLRGPAGSPWESPLELLGRARRLGCLADVDCAAVRTALDHVALAAAGRPVTLFVNVEPGTLSHRADELVAILADRPGTVRMVVELTERALAADPAGMLAGAERLRAAGCAVALDDVGAEPASLAFIPLLRPEVVKLDLQLLRTVEDPATLTVAGAVRAYSEATGADVVAEGIETPGDLIRARVLGASLGQGWLWGRPTPELSRAHDTGTRLDPRPVGPALRTTPFRIVEGSDRVARAPKSLLLPVSRSVETSALQARVPPMLLSSFQRARRLTPATAARYAELADRLPFVAAFGVDMPGEPVPGVRGATLDEQDPLAREWTVVVLGAHESVALIARDRGDVGIADGDREFDFTVTHDLALVTAAAHAMVGRLTAAA